MMDDQISDAFQKAIEAAQSLDAKARLEDARKAAEIVHEIPDPGDRATVIGVLEKIDTLSDLADQIAFGRIIPHPRRTRRR